MKFNITKFDIPNILTFFRLLCAPIFVGIFYMNSDFMKIFATIIFILAGISDFLDGYLARHWNAQSVIGTVLDPIADKLVVIVAIVMLIFQKQIIGIDIFPAMAILMREVIIAGLREALGSFKFKLPVSDIGKWKTAIQLISISILLFGSVDFINQKFVFFDYVEFFGIWFFWISAILSLYSGGEYVVKAFAFLRGMKNN